MRLTLNICGENIQDIKMAVRRIIEERMSSNQGGWNGPCHYDYFFTDTNDVWENTDDLLCLDFYKEK